MTAPHSFGVLAGWLIDGSGAPVRERVMIRVEEGVITALDDVSASTSSRGDILRFQESTVLPGLVDCHVHLFMSGDSDPALRKKQLAFTFDEASPAISRHLRAHLASGVIAVRDGGDYGGYALRFNREGQSRDQSPVCVKAAGRAWRAKGRYGRLIGRPPLEGLTLAQSIFRDSEGADHVKIVNSGLNSLTHFGKETSPQFGLGDLNDAVAAAGTMGLTVMAHANGGAAVSTAVQAGCRSIEHGFFMGRNNLELMAERGTFWVPTMFTMAAYAAEPDGKGGEPEVARRNLDHQLEQVSDARSRGVRLAVGTDSGSLGVHHGDSYVEELRLFRRAGLSVPELVMCATLQGACLLGIEGEAGQLRAGMPATFLVVPGGPADLLDHIRTPSEVFVRGVSVRDAR
ncbi:MAG: amidohydrolase family protein [Chloroflexota bacterium]